MAYLRVEEVFADRRSGTKLSDVVDRILKSPYVLSQIETPFDLVGGLNRGDYLDMSTIAWGSLPVELQIRYATAYQAWYAYHSGHPSVAGTFELIPGVEIKMRLIPPGKFRMGSPYTEIGRYPDEKQRMVNIKKAFWCGETEVTQEEWFSVMRMDTPRLVGELKPVTDVSWEECREFCDRVGMSLLMEEQWEYACRAGTTKAYNFGDNEVLLKNYAWYSDNSTSYPHSVRKKLSNAWGLYDMHGNVWEWTDSLWGKASLDRVYRGGGWNSRVGDCRSAIRDRDDPSFRWYQIGLRLCRSI